MSWTESSSEVRGTYDTESATSCSERSSLFSHSDNASESTCDSRSLKGSEENRDEVSDVTGFSESCEAAFFRFDPQWCQVPVHPEPELETSEEAIPRIRLRL